MELLTEVCCKLSAQLVALHAAAWATETVISLMIN